MKILYLDQNKWIDLARAVLSPEEHPGPRKVLEVLVEEAKAGRILIPLTSTNILETHKIVNPKRRFDLAYVQATLSQGNVFRGRYKRLEVEITDVLRSAYKLPPFVREDRWFLSNVFFESTLEWNDPRNVRIAPIVLDAIRANPPKYLFEYLTQTPDEVRGAAVLKFTEGAEKLRQDMEERRKRDAGESLSMRRRIHSALLMLSELDLIKSIARQAGIPNYNEAEVFEANARKIITETPSYYLEREIALKIEAQKDRPIEENDFRDMQAFVAVVRYADIIVAENQFSNLAIQAGLGKKYATTIMTDLLLLPKLLAGPPVANPAS